MTSFVLASVLCASVSVPQPTSSGEGTARLNDGWTSNSDDVSRAYAAEWQEQRPSVDDLVKMRIHGVTPEFVRQTRELGFKDLSIDDMVKMRIHRVTPEYVKEIRDLGYKEATLDQLVKLRIHRVTAAYIKAIRDLGYTNVSLDDYARMSIHGVTPEFIKEVRGMGFKDDMDADDVIELAIHGKKWLKMLKEKQM